MEAQEETVHRAQEAGKALCEEQGQHEFRAHINACGPPDRLEHCDRDEDQVYRRVDQQQDEVLVVPKPNAVVNPRAVVIHPEHTNIANPAMMTPVGLVFQTPFAVSSFAGRFLFSDLHRLHFPIHWRCR